MKALIRRNRYAIAACAVALAGAAGLGIFGIAQANAAEDANAAATENVEQRWEGDATLPAEDVAADLVDAKNPESTGANVEQRWEGDASSGEVNAENAGADEDAECNGELREMTAGDLVDGEASGSNEYVDVDEAANVNVSACEDPIELEERPADEE